MSRILWLQWWYLHRVVYKLFAADQRWISLIALKARRCSSGTSAQTNPLKIQVIPTLVPVTVTLWIHGCPSPNKSGQDMTTLPEARYITILLVIVLLTKRGMLLVLRGTACAKCLLRWSSLCYSEWMSYHQPLYTRLMPRLTANPAHAL